MLYLQPSIRYAIWLVINILIILAFIYVFKLLPLTLTATAAVEVASGLEDIAPSDKAASAYISSKFLCTTFVLVCEQ